MKKLTYKNGIMIDVLNYKLPCYARIIVAKNRKNEIVAWSGFTKTDSSKGWNPLIMVFVNPNYRGKGIAGELVQRVLTEFKPFYKNKAGTPGYKFAVKKLVYFDRISNLYYQPIKQFGFKPKLY